MDLTNSGTSSVFVLSISDAFFAPTSDHVIDSTEPVDSSRVHAVILSGTGARTGANFLLVRNSWGEDWGDAGYAWLSERYVRPRILHIIEIGKVP
jgi:aminopeptidase C